MMKPRREAAPPLRAGRPGSVDRLLVELGPGDRVRVSVLDRPSMWARRRLRRFAAVVLETPSFPPWPEEPA
jgi:hypothetical protein